MFGTVYNPYEPAFSVWPSIETSELKVTLVLELAPVLHVLPKGTRSPKIALPFTPGLEYSTDISVRPTRCSTVAYGLG